MNHCKCWKCYIKHWLIDSECYLDIDQYHASRWYLQPHIFFDEDIKPLLEDNQK